MTNPILITIEILIILIYPFVVTYFNQKAKNQADKEVLKKLTVIVEDIKKENTLQIDRGKQIFSEEKDSIIVFFAQLNTWIWESLNINFEDYNYLKIEDISKRRIAMQDAYNKSNVAFAKVMLIINDTDLVEAGKDAIKKTYEVHIFRESILIELIGNLQIQSTIKDKIANYYNENNENPSAPVESLIAYSKNYEDNRKKLICNNKVKNIELFGASMKSVNVFKDSAQNYLRK